MGALGSLIPLAILFTVIGGFAWFGYQIFIYSQTLATEGKKKMEKGPISFSKDGVKVSVKDVSREDYEDSTQSVLVKTWNLANEAKKPSSSRASSTSGKPTIARSSSGVSTGRAQKGRLFGHKESDVKIFGGGDGSIDEDPFPEYFEFEETGR